MTILYSDPLFRRHDTGAHPESSARLIAIDKQLAAGKIADQCTLGEPRPITLEQLASTHHPDMIQAAATMAAQGGGHLDPDTVVSPSSYDVALTAAGTALAAVDAVVGGVESNALCLIRPPGHHATPDRSMGFCLFNNVALAARYAQRHWRLGRVLIVDWDVHHGNGTQDFFYNDESVTFFSIHRFPFYPGTGAAEETGTGRGLGATINTPIAFGTPREQYLAQFQGGLERAAASAKPELILISAGFDAHALDPVGNLGLKTEDYLVMTRQVVEIAKHYAGGRIVSCLEGGYHVEALAESVAAHLTGLLPDRTRPRA